ncbi:MAG: NUDIX domain-containing protein [Oscillospiraceae bacterium]
MASIRNSIKAIIVRDGRLLMLKCDSDQNEMPYYILPGGGQEFGECFKKALRRECMEELGTRVEPDELMLVREFICENHAKFGACHQVEYMFRCSLLEALSPEKATLPDNEQIGLEWIEIARLGEYNIYPRALARCLDENGNRIGAIYIGAVD